MMPLISADRRQNVLRPRGNCGIMDPAIHSFIVKVFIDEPAQASGPGGWHGQITHVQSGEKGYLNDLDDICDFIQPYLPKKRLSCKLKSWIKRLLGVSSGKGR
jgi:hypothetical protein